MLLICYQWEISKEINLIESIIFHQWCRIIKDIKFHHIIRINESQILGVYKYDLIFMHFKLRNYNNISKLTFV